MSMEDMIKKALLLNNVCENDVTVIKTEEHHYLLHLFKLLVLLLCNFFLLERENQEEQYNFVMKNFNVIVDVVMTEIEVALLVYNNMCEATTNIIELHNKDECLIVVAIQDKVNQQLEKLIE